MLFYLCLKTHPVANDNFLFPSHTQKNKQKILPFRVRRGSNSYTQHNPSLPSSRSILSNGTTSSSYLTTSPPPFSPGGCSQSMSNTGPTSILRISDPTTIERYRYETCSSTTSNSVQSDESDAGIRYTYNISPSPPVEIDTPELRANVS